MTDIELSDDEAEAERVNAEEKGEVAPPPSKKRTIAKAAKKKILLKKGQKAGK